MNKVNVNFEDGETKIHYEDIRGFTVEPELDNHDNRTGVYELYLLAPTDEGFTYIKVMICKDKDLLMKIGKQIVKAIHLKRFTESPNK